MANAAGARANGIAANAALPEELTWELDESKGEMVLQTSGLANNGTAANAVRSGIIANAVEASEDIALGVANQDVEVDHRVYGDSEGKDMLDIIISNYTATQDNFKLTCAVYLDQEEEPYYVNLPYYARGFPLFIPPFSPIHSFPVQRQDITDRTDVYITGGKSA